MYGGAGNVINIYKPAGWTPVQAIERLKILCPPLHDQKVACAGRLDPMAEGVLLVLIGETLKRFDEFCGFDKEYEAEVIFGITSDSGDVMGIVESQRAESHKVIKSVEGVINNFVGELRLPVPVYSSWRVQGKSIYWWARQGRLGEIDVPMHEFTVYKAELLGIGEIVIEELKQSVMGRLEVVYGDFRQEEIKKQWERVVENRYEPFQSVKFRIHCTSGTYVRSIVQEMGRQIGVEILLYKLIRTRVGEYTYDASQSLFG